MVARAIPLLFYFLALHLSDALRREAFFGFSRERPSREVKKEGKKKKREKVPFATKFKNFFADESTTPAPTWNGHALYYEGRLPANYLSMSHDAKQDFYYRIERWHESMEEVKARGSCHSPMPGEKVIYFIQHGLCLPKADDAPLYSPGYTASKGIRNDPLLAKALSKDPKNRVQAIIVSPARKALQTAIVAFADIFPELPWELDANIRGLGFVEGSLVPQLGATALYELATNSTVYATPATSLLGQYRALPKGWDKATKPHKDRMFDFKEHLMERPEQRFVVVTHKGILQMANVSKFASGMVHIRALAPDGSWRRLSPPDCWP